MPFHELLSLEDARLEPYREIRTRQATERDGWFIAEGPILVEELLRSDFECQSILVQKKFSQRFEHLRDSNVDVFCLPDDQVRELVGFQFHRGILACGIRRALPNLDAMMSSQSAAFSDREIVVGLTGIHDPENLGSILRTAAGLGIRHVLFGPSNSDPFSRRSLKVAMGTTFQLNLWHSDKLLRDLRRLGQELQFEILASSLGGDATPLEALAAPGRTLVLFGNEANGLPDSITDAANTRVQIPMASGVDSLNVAVAAGIVLHYLARLNRR